MAAKFSSFWGHIHGKNGNQVFRVQRGHNTIYSFDTEAAPKPSSQKQKLYRATFGLMARYASLYSGVLAATFEKTTRQTGRDIFFKTNRNALRNALTELAQRVVNGDQVGAQEIADAVAVYAAENPSAIIISKLPGCSLNYLTGEWPELITITSDDLTPVVVRRVYRDGRVEDLYDYHTLGGGTVVPGPGNGGLDDGPSGGGGL